MAFVTLLSCFPKNYPQSAQEVSISVRGSFGESILRSRLDLVPFKSNPVLCQCSLNCSSSSSHGIGRETSEGGNSISDLGQQGLGGVSRRSAAKPARAIKITREPAVGKEEEEEEDESDDTELCPVDCVREFQARSEFDEILEYSREQGALVVVDFFKTACGSCRYIEKGFVKLCKGAGNTGVEVIFLKHNMTLLQLATNGAIDIRQQIQNKVEHFEPRSVDTGSKSGACNPLESKVMDEYEEQSEVAESLRIRVVPLFHFYKDGQLVESFATRDKTKILETICKHTGLQLEDISIPREV